MIQYRDKTVNYIIRADQEKIILSMLNTIRDLQVEFIEELEKIDGKRYPRPLPYNMLHINVERISNNCGCSKHNDCSALLVDNADETTICDDGMRLPKGTEMEVLTITL